MVPKGWLSTTIDDAKIKVIDGDRGKEYPKSTDFLEAGYCLFLSAKNVTKSGFLFDELQFINKDKDQKLRKGRVERGNIVLTTRGSVGQFAYFDDSVPYDVMRINSGMVVIDSSQSELSARFLYALCRSSIVAKQIDAASFGSAQPQLTVGIIKGIKLPVPPLPEQNKIAKILSTWDKAISTTEQLLANSQQQKKALMQQLLTGKKRLLDNNGVRFSGGWRERLLGDISKITTGSSNRQDSHMNGAYTFFDRSEDIRTSDTYLFDCEAVIVPGEGQDFIPKYFVGKFDLHQRTYAIMDFPECHGKFLFYAIHYFRSHFLSQAVGSTVKSLRLPMFQKMKLNLPTFEEQQKIAVVISTADQEITTLQQKLDALKQEKKALMQQLLTGKRRVKVVGAA
ncbi:restriction endonuclease subunit S [Aeromonas veronii]